MITMENIVRDGHPALRETAEPVCLPPTDADKQQLADMIEFVKNSQNPELAEKYKLRPGVGLAAPQINIKKRMIAVHAEDASGKLYSYALFNPKIVSHSVEKSYLTSGEGCLSVDEAIPGYVPRYARIRVKGTTLEGENIDIRLKGFPAIVFQHEIDHLNGVMFYDHIDKENPFKEPENAIAIER
ncbi:peptide deformylase [Bacillus inaquosorum]|uniref:peptide deformylase n=2 Tax=Bacillus inaquosorum TaxID=483913 RepID=UPI0022828767|nr:peptide deformylase [Bacillus inaquosorum]MCY7962385.1 peptide deformylase [Bacillus inaquosorum]MCY8138274.1 peptide deformylase [Bacillus inaquosorum]MCY8277356.1 peptide deformylase [Bacillus inaquosorum]MCY8387474.1 peptide deformylase [Bacillus inaquosorum]MCY8727626.1 peptide deformylase [Bacillus inaquosorum]